MGKIALWTDLSPNLAVAVKINKDIVYFFSKTLGEGGWGRKYSHEVLNK